MTAFNHGLQPLLRQAQHLAQHHRRSLVAGAVVLMSGFAVTAFGIAPLAPDAALLPQRVVQEAVHVASAASQADALAEQVLNLRRSDSTRAGDTPAALLARLGVADASAAAFLRTEPSLRKLFAGRAGKLVQAEVDTEGTLRELVLRFPAEQASQARTHFSRVTVNRVDGQWAAHQETLPLQAQMRMGSGTIRNSLFGATDDAGLPDAVASQLADLFSADIDFHRELRKGDTFSVVYEALTADGEPVPWNEGAGRVLAAEFVNGGRAHHAVWFDQPGGKGGYFGLDGQSRRRLFLASPMAFSRVTSGFAMRFHPLMQKWKAHLGVDYGAPTGTPVRTVGEGTVETAGWQNGYGNVVQVKHGNSHSTLYAHLSRIDVKRGQRIEQGQLIGAVGSTGWSTGPHLHFEFRVNGRHQDPLKVAKASEAVALDASHRARFAEVAQSLQGPLGLASSAAGAKARFE